MRPGHDVKRLEFLLAFVLWDSSAQIHICGANMTSRHGVIGKHHGSREPKVFTHIHLPYSLSATVRARCPRCRRWRRCTAAP